jgi:hypothetical protein
MDQPVVTDSEELVKSEDDVVSECSHCLDMRKFDHSILIKPVNRYRFFHQPCLEPPCSRFAALQSVLCDSCRHLRLWHLVACMRSEHHKWFGVVLLPGKDFAASQCPFCRMIGISMLSWGCDPATLEYPAQFYLEVGEFHEADEVVAYVCQIRPAENSISLSSIVDLQIVTGHDSRSRNA